MQIPVRDYTYKEFNITLKEVLEYHLESKKGKLRVNFFTVDAEDLDGVIGVLEKIGFNVIHLLLNSYHGFLEGWTEGLSDLQRYNCLGDSVTVNVIKTIAKRIGDGLP